MTTTVVKGSKTIGKGENARIEVERVTITSLADARRARVVLASKEYDDRTVVVTIDGQKLTFLREVGGTREQTKPPEAK